METPFEASVGENNRASDRGKEVVCNEPPEGNITTSELPKITQDTDSQEAKISDPKPAPSFSITSNPFSASSSRRPIVCKFCGQKFPTTQALGGHQNAHKQERELQKAMKAARDIRNNPFLYSLSGALLPSLSNFPGPYLGNRPQYHPYNGYSQRPFQVKPVYSGIGLPQSSPDLGQAFERFIGSSSMKPEWPTPYNTSSIGPTRRSNRPTNFSSLAGPNLSALVQAMENQKRLANNQWMESLSLNLPPKHNEPTKIESSMRQNESTGLDLELKL